MELYKPMPPEKAKDMTDERIRLHIMETGRLPWQLMAPRHVYAALFIGGHLEIVELFAVAPLTRYRGLVIVSVEGEFLLSL